MLSSNAIKVLEKRYLLRDENGEITESPDMLFRRVADFVAEAENAYGLSESANKALAEEFYEMISNLEFLPNSPTLMNAGKRGGQLSACFVLPVPDSLEGIFETCKHAALIHKTGGGTGFSFSRLRPANDRVASTIGVASGPVSFMAVYDAATEAIKQGGTRRGANMGILRVDHPDIEGFISAKRDKTKLTNFNISVAITDKFMEALLAGKSYELIHPGSGEIVGRLDAGEIFAKIVENAHATGEPGIIFIDRINAADPVELALDENGSAIPGTEDIEATNPCGEQPLGPGDACNLGSINLTRFIDSSNNIADIDWKRLSNCIHLAVRFLDDVIDANTYPFEFIARATRGNRRIGLGIMGWAESLIMLGIPYNSEKAIKKAEEVMSFFQKEAHEASRLLAESRGAFPNWQHTKWARQGILRRNATITTIAPTGTISIIAGTSSGIEPIFAISYIRRVMGGMELIEVNPRFESLARKEGFYSEELMREIAEEGSVNHIESVPEPIKQLWVCAHDISFQWHIRMQAAFQKFTDNAVSKTINFPVEASLADIKASYLMAWNQGLKGITVYRDASRESQVLNIKRTDPKACSSNKSFEPENNKSEEHPAKKSQILNIARTAEIPAVLSAHSKIKGAPSEISIRHISNNRNLVASKLKRQEASKAPISEARRYSTGEICPECGFVSGSIARVEACILCISCGYTKC